ncbi:hypothetical protein SAMN04488498_12611 [Mesorhizobium albiziae]|uniref:Uncharacterized protein n=2 Tax=Neomesorhizobium albiziae TaxID=335020 RepID=A0A1I4EFA7_9HYPH|nr:hypothetical protein SAMN04488498_12611 [Mesorhizobium albiziae]
MAGCDASVQTMSRSAPFSQIGGGLQSLNLCAILPIRQFFTWVENTIAPGYSCSSSGLVQNVNRRARGGQDFLRPVSEPSSDAAAYTDDSDRNKCPCESNDGLAGIVQKFPEPLLRIELVVVRHGG